MRKPSYCEHTNRRRKSSTWSRTRSFATSSGAFYTLVPIRPRSRGERRSLRTLPGVSLRPPLAFNPRLRRLSTPTDAFQLHPDIRSYGTTLRTSGRTGVIASEEEDVPVAVEETYAGNYVVVFDPLDGSSNLGARAFAHSRGAAFVCLTASHTNPPPRESNRIESNPPRDPSSICHVIESDHSLTNPVHAFTISSDAAVSTGSIFGVYDSDEQCVPDFDAEDDAAVEEKCIANVCQARPLHSHRSPYDRVRAVNAVP